MKFSAGVYHVTCPVELTEMVQWYNTRRRSELNLMRSEVQRHWHSVIVAWYMRGTITIERELLGPHMPV